MSFYNPLEFAEGYYYIDPKQNIHIKADMPENIRKRFVETVEKNFDEIRKGNITFDLITMSVTKIIYDPPGYNPTLKELLEQN